MIGIWWVNHLFYMTLIDRVDRTFLFANIALFVCVGFIASPSSLIAEHFRDNGFNAAVIIYCLTVSAAAGSMSIVWSHVPTHRRLIADQMDQRVVEQNARSVHLFAASCALAELIALWSPDTLLGLIAFLVLLYVFGVRSLTSTAEQRRQASRLAMNFFIAVNGQTAVSLISPLQQGNCPTRDTLLAYHLGLDRCLELGFLRFRRKIGGPYGTQLAHPWRRVS